MNRSRFGCTVFLLLALPLIGFAWQQLAGLVLGTLIAFGVWLLSCVVLIKVNQVGVVQNRITGGFTSLKGEGLCLVFRPFERLYATLSTLPTLEEGTLENLRSVEGVPLKVSWRVCCQLAPFNLEPALYNQSIPLLAGQRGRILRQNIETCLISAVGVKRAVFLCSGYSFGSLARVVHRALQEASLPLGINIQRVWIREITAPAGVEKFLGEAVGRKIDFKARQESNQSFLKDAAELSAEDREYLLNLEQLWAMRTAENGLAVYPPLRGSRQQPAREEESYP